MDAPEQARRLSRLYDEVHGGGRASGAPRALVAASWQRSLAASVDPELDAPPVVVDHDLLESIGDHHPLRAVLPVLRQTLTTIADEAAHIMIITDAQGMIMWRERYAEVNRQ